MKKKASRRWSDVKAQLEACDRPGLIGLVRDLYEASAANRRFLHARFVSGTGALEEYRDLVREAVSPDPLSDRPVRLRDALTTIKEYERSTGDLAGTVDLILEFVEAGTEQAADLGYGDDAYFGALERQVHEVVRLLPTVADEQRRRLEARLIQLGRFRDQIGYGYGDVLGDVAASVHEPRRQGKDRRTRHAV